MAREDTYVENSAVWRKTEDGKKVKIHDPSFVHAKVPVPLVVEYWVGASCGSVGVLFIYLLVTGIGGS